MGATIDALPAPEEAIKKGGQIIHEVGTTRMGNSPKTSVTNQYGQTWDCENVFVMDGGVFACLLYTSDAADERSSVDLGGRRIIKKKKTEKEITKKKNKQKKKNKTTE